MKAAFAFAFGPDIWDETPPKPWAPFMLQEADDLVLFQNNVKLKNYELDGKAFRIREDCQEAENGIPPLKIRKVKNPTRRNRKTRS